MLIEDHEIKERARIDRQRQDRINAANDAEKKRKEKESREKKVAETRRLAEEEVSCINSIFQIFAKIHLYYYY